MQQRHPAGSTRYRVHRKSRSPLIHALWAQVRALTARVAALEARLNEPSKTPGKSSLPPSKAQKANQPETAK